MVANPYQPPAVGTDTAPRPAGHAEFERVRAQHLAIERGVKGVGMLFVMTAIVGGLNLALTLWNAYTAGSLADVQVKGDLISVGISVSTAFFLRRLQPAGRWLATISLALPALLLLFVGISLLVSDIAVGVTFGGTGVGLGLLIYLLWRPGTKTVFSEHYRDEVVPATQHLARSQPLAVIGLIAVLVLVVGGVLYGVYLMRST